ncbi:MAG: hypothetical protein IKY67_02690 [Paludibacteraceae bacterium]|nr:hypothetical protein [Paludibacteraceae bacterium]
MAQVKTNQKEAVAKLKGFLEKEGFDVQQELSICLSDLSKPHMSKAKNGKIYINLTVAMRKEPDQWGRDLKVYVTPTKEDREQKANKIYVGGGKTFIFAQAEGIQPSDEEINQIIPPETADEKDDLPF